MDSLISFSACLDDNDYLVPRILWGSMTSWKNKELFLRCKRVNDVNVVNEIYPVVLDVLDVLDVNDVNDIINNPKKLGGNKCYGRE